MVGTKEISESRGSFDGPPVDPGYLARFAQAHEAAGFDRVLIGYHATGPDGFAVAAHVLIRGFDPLDDVVQWGRELVPLLRQEASRIPVGAPGAAEGALSA